MRDSGTERSKQQANLPIDQRPAGNESGGRGSASQEPQKGPGQPSPGLKDQDADSSDTYGNTRDSGDPATR